MINGRADVLVTLRDGSGTLLWESTFDNSYGLEDYGVAVATDNGGHYYVAAASFNDSANGYDYNILKYDVNGNLYWNTYYNGGASGNDIPTAITIGDSGFVYVTGTSFVSLLEKYDYLTMKLDTGGSIIWHTTYDFRYFNDIPSAIYSAGGRTMVTGAGGNSFTDWHFVTVGYNPVGGIGIQRNDSSSTIGFDKPTALAKYADGNFYLTGSASNGANGYDVILMKYDSSLNNLWTEYFDYHSLTDQANDVQLDGNGNIYLTGYATRANGKREGVVLKYDTAGTFIWDREETNSDSTESENTKLVVQYNGQIITTGWKDGTIDKDIYISAFDADGNATGYKENKGMYGGDDVPFYIECRNDTVTIAAKVASTDSTFEYQATQYSLDSILNVVSPNAY